MRRGFAMIMAITVIVILGTIMALTLNMSATSNKQTIDAYLHEQAILLTRSAVEYAMLEISGRDLCNNRPELLNAVYPSAGADKMFDINISMRYIGLNCGTAQSQYIQTISTPDSNGTLIMDVVVTADENLTTEPIRYHRRTLQKL